MLNPVKQASLEMKRHEKTGRKAFRLSLPLYPAFLPRSSTLFPSPRLTIFQIPALSSLSAGEKLLIERLGPLLGPSFSGSQFSSDIVYYIFFFFLYINYHVCVYKVLFSKPVFNFRFRRYFFPLGRFSSETVNGNR